MLRQLDSDPQLSGNERVQHLRSIMRKEDVPTFITLNVEQLLLKLLGRNKHNKMAFEYLMAHYMLTGKLEKVAANIHRLNDFDYKGIPRHYEEAILLYTNITGKEVNLHGRRISRETLERFDKFRRIFGRLKHDVRAVGNALRAEFGDSYFFCYVFYGKEELG